MSIPRLFGLIALTLASCSSESERRTQCLVGCSSAVTFALSRSHPGPNISIVVEEPDGSAQRLDCVPTGGSLACLPLSSRLVPNFDANGALQSVTLNQPAPGGYTVQLIVNDTPMGGGSFRYAATPVPAGPCGETCPASQSFTIGS